MSLETVEKSLSQMGQRVTELYRLGRVDQEVHSSVLVFVGALMVTNEPVLRKLAVVMLDELLSALESVTNTLAAQSKVER